MFRTVQEYPVKVKEEEDFNLEYVDVKQEEDVKIEVQEYVDVIQKEKVKIEFEEIKLEEELIIKDEYDGTFNDPVDGSDEEDDEQNESARCDLRK